MLDPFRSRLRRSNTSAPVLTKALSARLPGQSMEKRAGPFRQHLRSKSHHLTGPPPAEATPAFLVVIQTLLDEVNVKVTRMDRKKHRLQKAAVAPTTTFDPACGGDADGSASTGEGAVSVDVAAMTLPQLMASLDQAHTKLAERVREIKALQESTSKGEEEQGEEEGQEKEEEEESFRKMVAARKTRDSRVLSQGSMGAPGCVYGRSSIAVVSPTSSKLAALSSHPTIAEERSEDDADDDDDHDKDGDTEQDGSTTAASGDQNEQGRPRTEDEREFDAMVGGGAAGVERGGPEQEALQEAREEVSRLRARLAENDKKQQKITEGHARAMGQASTRAKGHLTLLQQQEALLRQSAAAASATQADHESECEGLRADLLEKDKLVAGLQASAEVAQSNRRRHSIAAATPEAATRAAAEADALLEEMGARLAVRDTEVAAHLGQHTRLQAQLEAQSATEKALRAQAQAAQERSARSEVRVQALEHSLQAQEEEVQRLGATRAACVANLSQFRAAADRAKDSKELVYLRKELAKQKQVQDRLRLQLTAAGLGLGPVVRRHVSGHISDRIALLLGDNMALTASASRRDAAVRHTGSFMPATSSASTV